LKRIINSLKSVEGAGREKPGNIDWAIWGEHWEFLLRFWQETWKGFATWLIYTGTKRKKGVHCGIWGRELMGGKGYKGVIPKVIRGGGVKK